MQNVKYNATWKLTSGNTSKDIISFGEKTRRHYLVISENDRPLAFIIFCGRNRMITISLSEIAYGMYMPI
jgi:hypothetical protein